MFSLSAIRTLNCYIGRSHRKGNIRMNITGAHIVIAMFSWSVVWTLNRCTSRSRIETWKWILRFARSPALTSVMVSWLTIRTLNYCTVLFCAAFARTDWKCKLKITGAHVCVNAMFSWSVIWTHNRCTSVLLSFSRIGNLAINITRGRTLLQHAVVLKFAKWLIFFPSHSLRWLVRRFHDPLFELLIVALGVLWTHFCNMPSFLSSRND